MSSRSHYFTNSIGVFQGGGVRGSAFAGAIEASVAAGIGFGRLAGTSAGSIAAAFIATGATHTEITKELLAIDFASFEREVDMSVVMPIESRLRFAIIKLFSKYKVSRELRVRDILKIVRFGGMYSSAEIERWLEASLRRLLATTGRFPQGKEVLFSDLPTPLSVVATDLSNRSYFHWSKEETPHSSVAAAVRCSCTIPFYFQPAVDGRRVFVDGGILSNLPTFIFKDVVQEDSFKYSPRILNFRLIHDVDRNRKPLNCIEDYLVAIAETVVDGATQIQSRMYRGAFTIDIPTGSVSSTDFRQTKEATKLALCESGKRAVEDFVADEPNTLFLARNPATYVGWDQKMLLLVQTLTDASNSITIFDESAIWVYYIFPTLFATARRGLSIKYVSILDDDEAEPQEAHCRRLIRGLGGTVDIINALPFFGFLADSDSEHGLAGLTHRLAPQESFVAEQTKLYSMHEDPEVFRHLKSLCNKWITYTDGGATNVPSLVPSENNHLIRRLETIPQYRGAGFTVRDVALNGDVFSIQLHVKEYKYLQADFLTRDYDTVGADRFSPQEVELAGKKRTIVTPPVLEQRGTRLVLIDGSARALHCLRNGVKTIKAVVVDGIDGTPLPAATRPLADLTIASRTLDFAQQYTNLDRTLWRNVDRYVHPFTDCS